MAAIPPPDPFGCFVGPPAIQPGPSGRLVAVKDNIDVAGLPTRNGLADGPVAAEDAPLVARLRAAGWGIAGKTRMDEAAFGATGLNPHHGRTENPAHPGHSPGGSSAGSAAAVAAGLADAALGTDTMGSVRIPAAYCGVIGLKPGRGVLPMAGVAPLSPTLDHAGLFARDAATLAALLRVFLPERGFGPSRVVEAEPQDDAVRRAALLVVEVEAAAVHAATPGLSAAARAAFAYGHDAGAARLMRAVRTLRAAEAALLERLRDADLVASPTVPAPAFAWADGPPADQARHVALANWAGLPAISLPIGPTGLHLVARPGEDWRLLQHARELGL
jgi:aspartyl-tRNA(Asn)/glutamyl-tRNA(Gln) amidotransferase subunit A